MSLLLLLLPLVHGDELVLRDALELEMTRSLNELRLADEPAPSLIVYDAVDGHHATYHAAFWAPLSAFEGPARMLRTEVRVGTDLYDSSNFDSYSGGNGVLTTPLPIEDDATAIRRAVWLSTDKAYKQAVEQFARKRAEIPPELTKEIPDRLSPPTVVTDPAPPASLDPERIENAVLALSAVMREFSEIELGEAAGRDWQATRVTLSSEGMRLSRPTGHSVVRVEAVLRLEDGSRLRDGRWWVARTADELPPLAEMEDEVREMCAWLLSLRDAPVLDDYLGPVLFEGPAAAELFRQLAAPEMVGTPPPWQARVYDVPPTRKPRARVGRRLLPSGWTIIDDPTTSERLGSMEWDHEGHPTTAVEVVRDGIVRELLRSGTPSAVDQGSTGHGRSRGAQRREALPSAVTVTPARARGDRRLRRRALKAAAQTGRDSVLVIRRIEPPAMTEEFDVYFTGEGPPPGLTPPYEAYLLYRDGTIQPVRGLGFRGVDRRILRDVLMAGATQPAVGVLDASPGPQRFSIGAVGGLPASWAVPSVLVSEVELSSTSGGDRREISPPRP